MHPPEHVHLLTVTGVIKNETVWSTEAVATPKVQHSALEDDYNSFLFYFWLAFHSYRLYLQNICRETGPLNHHNDKMDSDQ